MLVCGSMAHSVYIILGNKFIDTIVCSDSCQERWHARLHSHNLLSWIIILIRWVLNQQKKNAWPHTFKQKLIVHCQISFSLALFHFCDTPKSNLIIIATIFGMYYATQTNNNKFFHGAKLPCTWHLFFLETVINKKRSSKKNQSDHDCYYSTCVSFCVHKFEKFKAGGRGNKIV